MTAPLSQPDNRLYLGRGGSGKTTLALHHAGRFDRVLICNPNIEDQHREGAAVLEDPADLVELARAPRFRLCWEGFAADPDAGFAWANRVAWAAGDCLIVWDEADLFMGAGRLPPEAYRMWNMGRHRACRVFGVSRRPQRVSRDLTANLSRACVGQLHEPRDVAFLREFMGVDLARRCLSLHRFEFLDWTHDGASVKKAPFA